MTGPSTPLTPARSCPVCAGTRAEPWMTKPPLELVQCTRCSMVYSATVPPELASGRFYQQAAASYHLAPDKLESDFAPVRFQRELRLFRQYCRSGRVLDVGCSTGGFLHQLNARWPGAYVGVGTDVARPALDHAQQQGITVEHRHFLDPEFSHTHFDAVTFWAVLEHVAEPGRFLQRAAAVLNPGGWCFALVPNIQSLAVLLLGPQYRYIMPEHVNYFGPRSLRALAATAPALSFISLRSTHFNPVVIWQDRRRPAGTVPDAERGRLLKRTTRWKQSPWLAPLRAPYALIEAALGRAGLADNLIIVLQKHRTGDSPDREAGSQ